MEDVEIQVEANISQIFHRYENLILQELIPIRDDIRAGKLGDFDQKDLLHRLYWHCSDICIYTLSRVFRVSPSQIAVRAGRFDIINYCKKCSCEIIFNVKTREERDKILKMEMFCEDCVFLDELSMTDAYLASKSKATEIREAEIQRLRAMPYQEYLMTEHWKTIREATLKRDDRACRLCGSMERLQVHHRTYERRGCELPGDTTTLCEDCHQMFHDHSKLARPD